MTCGEETNRRQKREEEMREGKRKAAEQGFSRPNSNPATSTNNTPLGIHPSRRQAANRVKNFTQLSALAEMGVTQADEENLIIPAVKLHITHAKGRGSDTKFCTHPCEDCSEAMPLIMDVGSQSTLVHQRWVKEREQKTGATFQKVPLHQPVILGMANGTPMEVQEQVILTLIFPNGKEMECHALLCPTLAEPLILGTQTMDRIPEGMTVSRDPDPRKRRVHIPYGGVDELAWSDQSFREASDKVMNRLATYFVQQRPRTQRAYRVVSPMCDAQQEANHTKDDTDSEAEREAFKTTIAHFLGLSPRA